MLMESYIVRIYRRGVRDATVAQEIVGYLETPVSGNRFPFHNVEELIRMLNQRLGHIAGSGVPEPDTHSSKFLTSEGNHD